MRIDDLLLEQVLLVEEEDDGRVLEPRVRDDGAEQSLRLLHPVLVVRFKQNLVVLACNTPAMTRLNKKTIFNKEWNPPPPKKTSESLYNLHRHYRAPENLAALR